jgi:hypothetical protein
MVKEKKITFAHIRSAGAKNALGAIWKDSL